MRPSQTDLQILRYISQYDSADKKSILDVFPDELYETEFRLKAMSGILKRNPENFFPPLIEEELNYSKRQ